MGVFVGRHDEWTARGEIVGASSRHRVAAAVITGDPGSGKSRLLAEAAAPGRVLRLFHVIGYETIQVPASAVGLCLAPEGRVC